MTVVTHIGCEYPERKNKPVFVTAITLRDGDNLQCPYCNKNGIYRGTTEKGKLLTT